MMFFKHKSPSFLLNLVDLLELMWAHGNFLYAVKVFEFSILFVSSCEKILTYETLWSPFNSGCTRVDIYLEISLVLQMYKAYFVKLKGNFIRFLKDLSSPVHT